MFVFYHNFATTAIFPLLHVILCVILIIKTKGGNASVTNLQKQVSNARFQNFKNMNDLDDHPIHSHLGIFGHRLVDICLHAAISGWAYLYDFFAFFMASLSW